MTPPRLARWLLAAALPPDVRAIMLADLEDEMRDLERMHGPAAATRGYWRQAAASLPYALRLRLRAHGGHFMDDLSYGARLLRRNPTFAFAATVTLALGIAATSAVVTAANGVLMRPLPYANPNSVVAVGEFDRTRGLASGNVSWPDFLEYRERNHTLERLAGYNGGSRTLQPRDGTAERVAIASVTAEFFDVLGVRPALGRTFGAADEQSGSPPVAILTDGAWRTRFGGDAGIVGRALTLNGVSTEVIGVLPANFEFPPRGLAEVWLPMRLTPAQRDRKYFHWMNVIGRLKPGVSVSQATADVDAIARGFAAEDPKAHPAPAAVATPLRDLVVRGARPVLLMLVAAAGLVLAVACANLATLLLARGQSRTGEMGVRAALGAGRTRLARQVLVENLVLAMPGAVLGLVAGQWLVRLAVVALPRGQRAALPHLQQLGLDPGTAIISTGIVIATVLAFGLIPAYRTARLAGALPSRGAAGLGARDVRLQGAFVAAQVAFALVLLFGANLMLRSVSRVLDVSPGFETSHLVTGTVNLSGARYATREAVRAFHDEALSRLAALPGVTAASTIDQAPLTGAGNSGSFSVVGRPMAPDTTVLIRTVASNYFDVMGLPLAAGRPFGSSDKPESPRVAIVNQLLADMAFGGRPLGERVTFPFTGPEPFEIVGIVGNEQFDAVDQPLRPVMYFPYGQDSGASMDFVVRTAGDPLSAVSSMRAAIAELDPAIPLYAIATMDQVMGASDAVFRRRSVLVLMAAFAGAALVLAAVGIYGVLAQVVAQRRRDIGIRLALGAGARQVVTSVLRPGLVAVVIGLSVGVAGSLAAGRALGSLLFRTDPADSRSLLLVVTVLAVAAAMAAIAPARRALRVDPVESLRID